MRYSEFKLTEGFKYMDPNMRGGLARSGDTNAITELQQWLNDNGYNAGVADGIYGRKTATAVRQFQKDNGLTVDGDAGPKTISAMAASKTNVDVGLGTDDDDVSGTSDDLKDKEPTVDPKLAGYLEAGEEHKQGKKVVEEFAETELDGEEYDMLLRAIAGEASPNQKERAAVAAVILNRLRMGYGGDRTLKDVLTARNQFQAVTGTRYDRGPSRAYTNMTPTTASRIARALIQYLPTMDKSWKNFTSNNPKAYGRGTNIDFMYAMRKSPGASVIGQTVFGTA